MSETLRFGIDPDAEADKLGSPLLARVRHNIPFEPDEDKPKRLPGRPLTYPRQGYVRDSHDGGRADEFRGGLRAPEIGSDAAHTLQNVLPILKSQQDTIVFNDYIDRFLDELRETERGKESAVRAQYIARWRAHLVRNYKRGSSYDWSDEQIDEVVDEFAHAVNTAELKY